MTARRTRRLLTEEDRYHILALNRMGQTLSQIAEAVDRHRNTVRQVLTEEGVPAIAPATDEERAEWLRLHVEDGLTVRQIAERTGRNRSTINLHLNRSGISLRAASVKARRSECPEGHSLALYGAPKYRRDHLGLWEKTGGVTCHACRAVKQGYAIPAPDEVARMVEATAARKAQENGAFR